MNIFRKVLSSIICLGVIFTCTTTTFAASNTDEEKLDWDQFILDSKIESVEDNCIKLTSVEKISDLHLKSSTADNNKTQYVSTSVSILTNNKKESQDIANSISDIKATTASSGDQGKTVNEKTGLGKIWIRVYYTITTNSKDDYIKITKITGGHNVPRLSGGVQRTGVSCDYGQTGFGISGGYRTQRLMNQSGGTSFTKYPPSSWVAVTYNGKQIVGAAHKVSMKRGTSSWFTEARVSIN